ncbi:nitroreductase family protein [Clostridium sp. cel8]|uniref:nitroreductase family protein n=1 Tax=Clostridium sp. cel8 TaxID=2663123 RepID=UPI0015F7765D|nr:nitroreductase family protein [Clostridium sp. cel8]MBA5851612.1 nitroreductase family protein [Clostridium sp. cel8]
MEEIFIRRSIRKFKNIPVEKEKVNKLLRAAMQAPSAVNQQPWEFIVVEDKEDLKKLSQISPYSKPIANSPVTFILLGNQYNMIAPTAWTHDMGAASENMLLEAVHLGLGGVWFGVATSEEISKNLSRLYNLPEYIKPFGLISVGYPDGQKNEFVDRYREEKVHYGKW